MRTAAWHIISGLAGLIVLSTLVSCGSDDGRETPDVPSATAEMTLDVTLAVPTNADGANYEEGSTDENYIDVAEGDYRIYFFDTDNKLIARFEPSGFITTEGSDYQKYSVLGKVPDALVEHLTDVSQGSTKAIRGTFRMMVIANWRDYEDESIKEGKTYMQDICDAAWAQYDCHQLDPANDKLMPFFGVHEYEDVTFTAGQATILPEAVTLLRAMAKVEVTVRSAEDLNLSLSYLRINRYNAKGYCAPTGVYTQDQYDHGNYDSDYVQTLHLVGVDNDEEEKNLDFTQIGEWTEDGSRVEKYVIYLPEYKNAGAGDMYSSIKAKFNVQPIDESPYTIYFAEYVEGVTDNADENRLNIERNNIYRFDVTCTSYDYFSLTLTVSDWEGLYENVFDFGNRQIVSPVSPWENEINNDIEF